MIGMESIESRELKGVSIKTLWAIIVATATIILSVMGSYTALKGEITDLKYQNTGDAKYNDLRMKQLEQRAEINAMNIKELSKRIDEVHKVK